MKSRKPKSKPKVEGERPLSILTAWADSKLLDSNAVELLRGLPPAQFTIKTFNNVIPHDQRKLCKPTQRQFIDPAQIPPI